MDVIQCDQRERHQEAYNVYEAFLLTLKFPCRCHVYAIVFVPCVVNLLYARFPFAFLAFPLDGVFTFHLLALSHFP